MTNSLYSPDSLYHPGEPPQPNLELVEGIHTILSLPLPFEPLTTRVAYTERETNLLEALNIIVTKPSELIGRIHDTLTEDPDSRSFTFAGTPYELSITSEDDYTAIPKKSRPELWTLTKEPGEEYVRLTKRGPSGHVTVLYISKDSTVLGVLSNTEETAWILNIKREHSHPKKMTLTEIFKEDITSNNLITVNYSTHSLITKHTDPAGRIIETSYHFPDSSINYHPILWQRVYKEEDELPQHIYEYLSGTSPN